MIIHPDDSNKLLLAGVLRRDDHFDPHRRVQVYAIDYEKEVTDIIKENNPYMQLN